MVANIAASSIQFLLTPILSRFMEPIEFGCFAMFQSWIGLLSVFAGAGVDSVILKRYYNGNGGSNEEILLFVSSGVQVIISFGALLMGLGLILKGSIAGLYKIPEGWVLVGVIVSVLTALIQVQLCVLNLSRDSYRYTLIQVGQILIAASIAVVLVVKIGLKADGRVMAQLVSAGIVLLIIICQKNQRGRLMLTQWSLSRYVEIVKTWVEIFPHLAGIYLISMFDRLVIGQNIGVAELGVYSVALQTSMAVGLVFDAINKMYVPYLFETLRKNSYRQKIVIVRWIYVWFVFTILVGLICSYAVPSVLQAFFKAEYQSNKIVVVFLSIGQSFWGMYLAVTNIVLYANQRVYLSLSTVVIGFAHMVLLIVLVKGYGVVGASMGYCISMFVRFIATWYLAFIAHPMPWLPAIHTRLSRGIS